MSFPTVFNNLPGSPSTNPASLIDTMFNIVGGMGAIPCTATGTNAITLTPVTNYYLPAAYANFQMVGFTAAASSTGSVTIRLGALSFLNLYMPSGLQAGSGDIVLNNFYIAAFNGALNSGNGGFQVFNASTPSVIQPVQGTFKNLKITNGGTPDTQIAITADQVMLQNNAGGAAKVSTVSVTISMVASGANGLDAGSVAQATWYYIYVIYNGSTTAGLASTSPTSPTLPAGYTFFTRLGAITTGAASTNLTRIIQYGRDAQYVVTPASQTAALPVITSPVGGSPWNAYSVSSVVPTAVASKIRIASQFAIAANSTSVTNALMVAPNNNYSTSSGLVTSPFQPFARGANYGGGTVSEATQFNDVFEFVLESTNIYAGIVGAQVTSSSLSCIGWTDNI